MNPAPLSVALSNLALAEIQAYSRSKSLWSRKHCLVMTDTNFADFLLDHTETTLSIRERELLGVIETIPAMLWATRPDGEPTHLSRRFLKYRGASFEEFVNRGWERP